MIIKIHIPIGARDVDSKTTAPLDESKTVIGICFEEDEYVDDANYLSTIHLPLYLHSILIDFNEDNPKDSPKTNLPGFISNLFILFWSIYY